MEIRTATKEDLLRILELGKEFGHLMGYQKDPELMEKYLPRILVAEEFYPAPKSSLYLVDQPEVVGYYHYIVSGDSGFGEMLRCYRQFPEKITQEACHKKHLLLPFGGNLCICMQGASHREVFREFIKYLQGRYPEIWCYCSIKSRRPDTYRELGFTFNSKEQFTFWNTHKGDYSVYQLGRWKRATY